MEVLQKEVMKTKAKVVMVLSDLHVGSTVGLWPKDFTSNEGNLICQNKFQEWLWECWEDMLMWAQKTIEEGLCIVCYEQERDHRIAEEDRH
jgi:hypothetical protein